MRKNKLREMLNKGKPTIGTRVFNVWPGIVEVIGRTGAIDYIEFMGEYGAWDLHDLDNFARATELFDMSSMMKVNQEPRGFLAQRALGSGIQNILFADVRTVQDAEECVRIVRAETPETQGINGCHGGRSVGYILEGGSSQYIRAMNDAVVALMIEKKQAVDNLEEILSVGGIDMVQFGACDYCLSIGLPRQFSHPKVKEAELKTITTALKMGLHPRIETTSLKSVQEYLDIGVRNFSLSTDMTVLYQWFKENGESMRRVLS